MAPRLRWRAGTVLKGKGHRSTWGRKQKAVVAEWGFQYQWNPGPTEALANPLIVAHLDPILYAQDHQSDVM